MNLLPTNHRSERLNVTGEIDQGRLGLSGRSGSHGRGVSCAGFLSPSFPRVRVHPLHGIGAQCRPSGALEIVLGAT